MSIKNIIDGSFDANAPIEIEKLEFSNMVVSLVFNKVGNLCTLQFKNYSFIMFMPTISYIIVIYPSDDVNPFKPNDILIRDFYLTVGGEPRWCKFTWDVIPNTITVNVGPIDGGQTLSISNSEYIVYNVN